MPQESKQIDKYSVHRMTHYSGNVRAVIWLYSGQTPFGRLKFLENQFEQPVTIQSGILQVTYPIGAFSEIVDILRNEKPVFLTYVVNSYARIESEKEPSGEGEDDTV